jgi:hypothetical protein
MWLSGGQEDISLSEQLSHQKLRGFRNNSYTTQSALQKHGACKIYLWFENKMS